MDEVLKKRAFFRDADLQLYYANNQALRPFGYRLVPDSFPPAGDTPWTLFKDDQVLLDQVADFGPVTVNADGSDFLLSVSRYNVSRGMYLVRKDSIEQGKGDPYTPRFGLLGRDLVGNCRSGPGGDRPAVPRRPGDLLRQHRPAVSDPGFLGACGLLPGIGRWRFWTIPCPAATGTTPAGQVIVDGVSLNQRYGYQEIFGFRLLNGQPFYFFRKDGKIGAVYAGQPVLLGYDTIPHYGCCSAGELNPRRSGSMIWFFAERGGAWYYVEIGSFL